MKICEDIKRNKVQLTLGILAGVAVVLGMVLSFNAGVRWSVTHGALSVLLQDPRFEKELREELGRNYRASEEAKWRESVVCRTDTIEVCKGESVKDTAKGVRPKKYNKAYYRAKVAPRSKEEAMEESIQWLLKAGKQK